ncbi:MAG: hypothetical protein AAGH43_14900 [Pseudomonadota bacterium]
MTTTTPVLFTLFNRPDLTARTFAAIRDARPARLYIAADGPREGSESEICMGARAVTEAVDWPCQVKRLYQEENLGCRRAMETAIDWFFTHEVEGIILEDDCLVTAEFFAYCAELLEHYQHAEEVMAISGDRSFGRVLDAPQSYSFSRFPLIWGWATWRRAWRHYDFNRFAAGDFARHLRTTGLPKPFADAFAQKCAAVANGTLDTWDYTWSYAVFMNQGLTCIPKVNLVTNIGHGPDATHTRNSASERADIPVATLPRPLTHPEIVSPDRRTDTLISLYVHGIVPWRQPGDTGQAALSV